MESIKMYELHEQEQYFFDVATREHLAEFVRNFPNPCCLCAPLLGQALVERGVSTTILDTDDRFSSVAGFQHYDLYRPAPLQQTFGLIVCDPPFFKVSLSQLFQAVRLLSQFDYTQPLLICYLRRRTSNIMGTFSRFNLVPTGYLPHYQTVQSSERNEIEFFSNLDVTEIERLRS
ncbi:MAG TPA: hypothetical protein VF600_17150 [Abditibacteriaceae bacterium]